MEKVLTIVVPSYNVEKYLEQTLNSFVEETVLREIEVLI
ncbi:MAG: glycosyltransferase family 2 protein, partial [Lachnospiraceae bacterium]